MKAIAPAVSTTDYYTAPWYSEGGAASWHTVQSWTTQMAMVETLRQLGRGSGDPQLLGELTGMMADPQPHLEAMPPSRQPAVEKVWPWWAELLSHPARDAWWQGLSVLDRAERGVRVLAGSEYAQGHVGHSLPDRLGEAAAQVERQSRSARRLRARAPVGSVA